jgi:hypothetical protein
MMRLEHWMLVAVVVWLGLKFLKLFLEFIFYKEEPGDVD